MRRLLVAVVLVHVVGMAAMAQSEGDLKRYFEGRKVTVLIDMPATKEGVDIYPERDQPLEFHIMPAGSNNMEPLVEEEGDRLMITRIRVKEKHLEFQLGRWRLWDVGRTKSPLVSARDMPARGKREKWLRKTSKGRQTKPGGAGCVEYLDDLRRKRQRERSPAPGGARNRHRTRKTADRATPVTRGGSRFNIHFETEPGSSQLTPEAVMKALSEYVESSDGTVGRGVAAMRGAVPASPLPAFSCLLTANFPILLGQRIKSGIKRAIPVRTSIGFVIGVLVGLWVLPSAVAQNNRLGVVNNTNHVGISRERFDEALAFYPQKMGFRGVTDVMKTGSRLSLMSRSAADTFVELQPANATGPPGLTHFGLQPRQDIGAFAAGAETARRYG